MAFMGEMDTSITPTSVFIGVENPANKDTTSKNTLPKIAIFSMLNVEKKCRLGLMNQDNMVQKRGSEISNSALV
jgi:hypothetical protein